MSLDHNRIEAMNNIASAMMDGALPLLLATPPDIGFEAAMGVLFFLGEKAGYSPEQMAEMVKTASENIEVGDDA